MGGGTYRDLIVWRKAIALVEEVYRATSAFLQNEMYRATSAFLQNEMYGLTSQMRCAAVSIPSNIAEGQGRRSRREFRRFLSMVHGSLREVETQIIRAERLGMLHSTSLSKLMTSTAEIGRLLNALRNSLARKDQ